MSYWVNKIDVLIEQQKKGETPLTLEGIPGIAVDRLFRRSQGKDIDLSDIYAQFAELKTPKQ